jgi:glucose/arabinose dehydrogenase
MFLTVGSGSNVALDMSPEPEIKGGLASWKKTRPLGAAWDTEERRADVLSFTPEGKDEKIFATGLRNCVGLTVQPDTGELWCAVNERDEIGDDVPFEYATHVREGAFYGWPWFYIGGNEDPHHKGERPDLKDKVTVPDVLMEAHSAPLQIAFYDGDKFPTEYIGDAFVTLHGSWNRGDRSGNKVVRLLFKNGADGRIRGFLNRFRHLKCKSMGTSCRYCCRAGRFVVRNRRCQRHNLARQLSQGGHSGGNRTSTISQ